MALRTEDNVRSKGMATGEMVHTRNKHMTASFMDQDKAQKEGYIRDLEKTITINKQIISELLKGASKAEGKDPSAIERINEENIHLQTQLRTLTKERDSIQAKLLIAEQIIEDQKKKEQELRQECEDKLLEYAEELDKKEYAVHDFEYKLKTLESVLSQTCSKDGRVGTALGELHKTLENEKELKASNIADENATLAHELEQERSKKRELEEQLNELDQRYQDGILKISELQAAGATSASMDVAARSKKPQIPRLDLSNVRRPGNRPISEPGYIHKLEESIKLLNVRITDLEEKNRVLQHKNMQLENTNANLFSLNERLSKTLQDSAKKRAASPARRNLQQVLNKSAYLPRTKGPEPQAERDFRLQATSPGMKAKESRQGMAEEPKDRALGLQNKAAVQYINPRLMGRSCTAGISQQELANLVSNSSGHNTREDFKSKDRDRGKALIITAVLNDAAPGDERPGARGKDERMAELPSDHVTDSTTPSDPKSIEAGSTIQIRKGSFGGSPTVSESGTGMSKQGNVEQ